MSSIDIPLRVITPADVRASVRRARKSLEAAAEEIVWQIEMEAWRTLGYTSWTAMREAEYGGAAFMVPSKSRPEIVQRIKEIEVGRTARGNPKHLTDKEIADTAGVSPVTIRDDLGKRDKIGDSTKNVTKPDGDILDAEIVPEPEHTGWLPPGFNPGDLDELNQPAPKQETTHPCPTCNGTGKVTK